MFHLHNADLNFKNTVLMLSTVLLDFRVKITSKNSFHYVCNSFYDWEIFSYCYMKNMVQIFIWLKLQARSSLRLIFSRRFEPYSSSRLLLSPHWALCTGQLTFESQVAILITMNTDTETLLVEFRICWR